MKKGIVLLFGVIVCSFKFYDTLVVKASMGQGRGQRGNGNVSRGRGRGYYSYRGRGNPRVSSLGDRQSLVGATGGIEESHLTKTNQGGISEPQISSNVVKLDSSLEEKVQSMPISDAPLQEPVVRRKTTFRASGLEGNLDKKDSFDEEVIVKTKDTVKMEESQESGNSEQIRKPRIRFKPSTKLEGYASLEEFKAKYDAEHPYAKESSTYPFIKLSKFKAALYSERWQKYFEQLDEGEKRALKIYTHRNEDITKYLAGDKSIRETHGKNIEEVIRDLDSAMEKSNLEDSFIVYRADSRKYYGDLKPGDIIEPNYYFSTTGEKHLARKYSNSQDKKESPLFMEIRLPRESKAIYVGRGAGGPYVKEFILDRRNKYKVRNFDGVKLELEVITEE